MKRMGLALSIGVVLALLLTGCGGGGAPKVDWELKVTGAVDNPLALSYADLVGMEQTELTDVQMEKSTGETELGSWSGAPLEAILQQAGASANYVSVTAVAADGYAIEISKDELQGAIVALKKGDEWIAEAASEEGKGPIRIVCPQTPGNRWVFQLQELQVNE